MKTLTHNNTTITYPSELVDITFQQFLYISETILNSNSNDLRLIIFDLLNNLVKVEGEIKEFEDLTIDIGRPITQEVSDLVKSIMEYQIVVSPQQSKQITKTNSKIINIGDRYFTFIPDLSKMKMSKYIELELIINSLSDSNTSHIDVLKQIIGKVFIEVKKNEPNIYIDTDENEIIQQILQAPAVEVIRCINFFLSIANGSKNVLKKHSNRTSNTKRK